jgi:uncharacterized protein with PIN domain
MLGRLARWLRTLGYDALYEGDGRRGDEEMAEQALREGRVLVTRDRRIPPRRGLRVVVLREAEEEPQLQELLRELGLTPDRARRFSRCTVCNAALAPEDRDVALAEAPPRVRELDTPFFRCVGCGKLYWMGTHTAATARKLDELGL